MPTSTGGAAPNTKSTLLGPNGTNKTSTALSTNILILVNNNTVGAIQNIDITETRSIQEIDEVGTDGHIDSAPNKSTDISVDCTRIRFDGMRVAEAFSRGYIHASAQRLPFDIEIHDTYGRDTTNPIVTVIKNIWINKLSTSYKAGDFIVSESMGGTAEAIYSHLGTTNQNAVSAPNGGGERGFTLVTDDVERAADRGDHRGALDAADLLHAFGT